MQYLTRLSDSLARIAFLTVAVLVANQLSTSSASAQSRVGTTAATFLTMGAGAKGSALGHAYTAEARGPDALFWNPGGSAIPQSGNRGGAMFTNSQWIADIDYNLFGVVLPVTSTGVLGVSIMMVDYGDMDVTTVASPEGTGETFSASDLSFGVTYAMPLTNDFYFGGTAKYIRQGIRDMTAQTMAFDFGFILQTRYFNGATIAASIMNFGGKMRMDGVNGQLQVDLDPNNTGSSESIPARLRMQAWDLPLSFKFGVGVPAISTETMELRLLGDINQTNDNNLNADWGTQFRYRSRTFHIDFRLGYKDSFIDEVDSHLSYGAGLEVQLATVRFGFDFAYIPFDYLDNSKIFDFRVYF